MIASTLPGYPRIGRGRELKKAVESYWRGRLDVPALEEQGRALRRDHWVRQRDAGVRWIPVGDFSWYDGMLDAAVLLGWVPRRFGRTEGGNENWFSAYFAMARGTQETPALEMTKWFDTNYHYIVPEVAGPPRPAEEAEDRLLALLAEARGVVGDRAKPVLVGPYTFLRLARITDGRSFDEHLEELGPAYGLLLARLAAHGAEWIQLDEPALVRSGPVEGEKALVGAYEAIRRASGRARILLQTYFGPVWERRGLLERLPVDGHGLDLVRGSENWRFLEEGAASASGRAWVAGVLDGRNVWRADLEGIVRRLDRPARALGDRLWVGSSCSLQFLPYTVDAEPSLDGEVRSWLAFAEERLDELEVVRRALEEGPAAVAADLRRASESLRAKAGSRRTTRPEVRARLDGLTEESFRRPPFSERRPVQTEKLGLSPLPTTTIGSFPQTGEVRKQRRRYKDGEISEEAYRDFIRGEIEKVIRLQEEIDLDVLVHGEFERSDMVDYFGERLEGMAVTENGWVQSYGTRCVRPPVIYGDISRPAPMTVRESRLAQLMTRRPVKGMLTGPVTLLNWSFPREDLPRQAVVWQLALALRDELSDLEAAGIGVIQVDEPAFREGLPLREEERPDYLEWAVAGFRLATSGVRPETQIHTHMCYSEFNEIIREIAAMDADVISIENSRSSGELLKAFQDFRYQAGIGPGVYDIHSPRTPSREEIEALLRRTLEVLPRDLVWVNPDCGLKTRSYEEVVPALRNMVEAARQVRAEPGA